MTQPKITNLRHGTVFIFCLHCAGLSIVLEDQNIVNFDVSVNQTSLVDVPEASQDVLRPKT